MAQRCAIYTRVSVVRSEADDLSSCDVQRQLCEEFVRSRAPEGWTCLPERFDDQGFTGADSDRPALVKLLEFVDAGKADRVVVCRLDRLTRRVADWAGLLSRLRDRAVALSVVSGELGFGEAATSDLLLNILAAFAQFEHEIIGERLRDSRASRRRQGLRSSGRIPFGFESDPSTRQLRPVKVEVELVRQIFHRAAWGSRPTQIATWLNEVGIKTKSTRSSDGGPWSAAAVLRLLQNRTYLGELGGTRASHSPVIEEHLFERANQVVRERRSRQPGRRPREPKDDPFLLRGLVRCIHCKNLMTTSSGPRRTKAEQLRYYRCRSRGACKGTQVPAAELEARVLRWLRSPTPCKASTDAAYLLPLLAPVWPVLFPRFLRSTLKELIREVRWDGPRNRFTVALDRGAIYTYAAELRAEPGASTETKGESRRRNR